MTSRGTLVLLIAPSLDIVGGQSVQASRLLELLQHSPDVQVEFLPINPRLPGPLRQLQRVKYLGIVLTSGTFPCELLAKAGRFDILHSFLAANYSFLSIVGRPDRGGGATVWQEVHRELPH